MDSSILISVQILRQNAAVHIHTVLPDLKSLSQICSEMFSIGPFVLIFVFSGRTVCRENGSDLTHIFDISCFLQ